MQLVEREELLTHLEASREQASSGGRLVFVAGEAGVGKTSLARRLAETSPATSRVLWGACDPFSTPSPLAPFADMPPFAALLEEPRGRHTLLRAILDELSLHTLMVVEDAHWADEATLDALRFVGRRVTTTRSLVLVTYRDDELGAGHPLRTVVGDLSTAGGCDRLHVPPLTAAGVRTLAAGYALDPERLHRATGGNAFYVTEVLAAPGWSVPLRVSDAVLARASRLSSEARPIVDVVSLAPGGLELEVAAAIVGRVEAPLDEAVERGVLVLDLARASFRHELARLAIEGGVPAARRSELHARLLEELQRRRGSDPARLAHHADAAGDRACVLRYAPIAAREASIRGAHREAARQLERAVAYADGLPASELAGLLSFLAEERLGFDEPAERAKLLERIVALQRASGDQRGLGTTLARLGRTFWAMGRSHDAVERVREAVEVLEQLPPGPELARAYAAYSFLEMFALRGSEAVAWGTRAIELAERVTAPEALRMALSAVGAARITCFEQLEGVDDLERAVRLASADGDDFEVGRGLGNLGACLSEIRRYDDAASYLERAIAFDDERDLDALAAHTRAELAMVRFQQGRWDEADPLAGEALRQRDVSVGIGIVGLCVRGRIGVRRGRPEAHALLEEAWELASESGDLQWTWPLAAGRAEAVWLAGRPSDVAPLVQPTYDNACELGVPWAVGELGSWLLRAGMLERLPDDVPEPYALPWRQAAEAWGRIGCPYEQAEALAEGDEMAMREALAILTRLGADPAADRVRERMRGAGLKRVPARARASTRDAPAQLTRRQLEVLSLLESGLTNAQIARRLFISEKTAIHHVSAILQKLGASSRGEAAAAARKMGITATPT